MSSVVLLCVDHAAPAAYVKNVPSLLALLVSTVGMCICTTNWEIAARAMGKWFKQAKCKEVRNLLFSSMSCSRIYKKCSRKGMQKQHSLCFSCLIPMYPSRSYTILHYFSCHVHSEMRARNTFNQEFTLECFTLPCVASTLHFCSVWPLCYTSTVLPHAGQMNV